MKATQIPEPSLEELAAKAVRLGRELEEMAHGIYLGRNSKDFGSMSRTLRHLRERTPFAAHDEQSLDTFRGILDADLRSEVVGMERRFFETRYDEFGQHGEVRECPLYTERGKKLLAVLKTFEAFIVARNAALDRAAGERALRQLLSF
jgi:hypothetical protein